MPVLEADWDSEVEKETAFNSLAHNAYGFCSVYLANGYLKGWQNETSEDRLEGTALRDMYLDSCSTRDEDANSAGAPLR